MIKVTIPNNNIRERKYIIEIILGEFLGINYRLEILENNCIPYEILLENGNKLIVEDHFFNKYPNDLEYLKLINIPTRILKQSKRKNQFIVEEDIPIIFGIGKIKVKNQLSKTITCSIDIFSSAFFMLSRWEEYVNKKRDSHNRFSALNSIAYQNGFLDRPIVNEYVEMLWNMLKYLGIVHKRKKTEFQLILTHDVDIPLLYNNFTGGVREIWEDLIKRKNIFLALTNLSKKLRTHLGFLNDPFNTFDYLMNLAENGNLKAYFFFMGRGQTRLDNHYKSDDKFIIKLIEKIKRRGHHIGIHPTYNAYNNIKQLRNEKEELENNFSKKILFGREHFLRFEIPVTWQIWDDVGMEWDSTMCYADMEGFRCGTCYEFSVYNIISRKQLQLKEKPLIVMDGSFITYQSNIKPAEMEKKINYLYNKVKYYNGNFVILWHNSSFNTNLCKPYQYIFNEILNY